MRFVPVVPDPDIDHQRHRERPRVGDPRIKHQHGALDDAFQRVRDSWEANQASAVLAAEMIRLYAERDAPDKAEEVFTRFRDAGPKAAIPNVANTWIEVLLDHDRNGDARRLLDELAVSASAQDAIDAAILARRLREPRIAHRYFQQAGDAVQTDSRALHEFAQTKMWLAQEARGKSRRGWHEVNRRLLVEARGLLERVIQMDASPRPPCLGMARSGANAELAARPGR